MIYDWFKIFNATEFYATGLVSRTLTLDLEDLGEKTFLITRGNLLSFTVDDVMLSVQMNGMNPFPFDGKAIYIDGNSDVYYGIEVEE